MVVTVIVLTIAGIVMTVQTGDPRWLFISLPFTFMVFVAGRYAPSGYRLAGDGVHVERRAGPKVIRYRDIREVDRAPRRLAGLTMFASNGIFGSFGRFWNPQLGFYHLHLTNRDTVVWLATAHGLIALSPDRPDEFVESLRRRLPRS